MNHKINSLIIILQILIEDIGLVFVLSSIISL